MTVAWHPKERILATGSNDLTLKLWDLDQGNCYETWAGHQYWVVQVAWNSLGTLLASGSFDGTIRLWEPTTGDCLKVFTVDQTLPYAMAWSPEGRILALPGSDDTLQLWDVDADRCVRTLVGHEGLVTWLRFSPDGTQLVSGSNDHLVRLWDLRTAPSCQGNPRNPRNPMVLSGHTAAIYSLAFSPDGAQLVSGAEDGQILLWDVALGELVRSLKVTRPYEGLNITGIQGITPAQKNALKQLGAVESRPMPSLAE
jgi:WD40 repeat protein